MAAAPHSVCGIPAKDFLCYILAHKLSVGERKVRAPQDRVLGNAQSR
jgi:hypothetical protein